MNVSYIQALAKQVHTVLIKPPAYESLFYICRLLKSRVWPDSPCLALQIHIQRLIFGPHLLELG